MVIRDLKSRDISAAQFVLTSFAQSATKELELGLCELPQADENWISDDLSNRNLSAQTMALFWILLVAIGGKFWAKQIMF